MRLGRTVLSTLGSALLLGSCASDYTITLRNRANVDMVPYPVVTTPPPPHRAADPANTLAHNQQTDVDPTGFNPLFFHAGSGTSVTFQLSLDTDPPQILIRIMQHQVPPGQEGTDPALQPQLADETLIEPTQLDLVFTIRGMGGGFPVDFSES